jgi:hypothetical protein
MDVGGWWSILHCLEFVDNWLDSYFGESEA